MLLGRIPKYDLNEDKLFILNGRTNEWYLTDLLLSDMITFNDLSQNAELHNLWMNIEDHEELVIYA